MTKDIDHRLLLELNDHLASHIGLSFPPDLVSEFSRKIKAAAKEFDMEPIDCVNWLLSSPLTKDQIHTLSYHLTIGETYFFRDPKAFEILEDDVLAKLIKQRRSTGKYLRVWSAGCCTGEEPYSVAILLSRLLDDISSWRISILGTDINSNFLKKAQRAIYEPWSFRVVSPAVKVRYFKHVKGKYELDPAIKKMVHFERMNLADEKTPQGLFLSSMDIIFCRNVLMYFHKDQAARVMTRLHAALTDGGVLVSTPFELSSVPEQLFERLSLKGAALLKKRSPGQTTADAGEIALRAEEPARKQSGYIKHTYKQEQVYIPALAPIPEIPSVTARSPKQDDSPPPAPNILKVAHHAKQLFDAGSYHECISHLLPACSGPEATPSLTYLLARACCNSGQLDNALKWIDRTIELDKLNHSAYFTRATILEAQGKPQESLASLRQAIFLEPRFVIAEFYMAGLLLRSGNLQESRKRFKGALSLLAQYNEDDIVPESEGIMVGHLARIVESLLEQTNERSSKRH
jgi:chemotaxis protein methyltransferase CheR